MPAHLHLMSLLVGITSSIVFPIIVCFHRTRAFAAWAKIASIVACISGLGWGFLSWKLTYCFISDLSYDFNRAYDVKGLLGGICIGLVFSVLISKPYVKRVA